MHVAGDVAEQTSDLQAGLADLLQEGRGKGAVASVSIGGDGARLRGIGDDRAGSLLDPGEAAAQAHGP